MVGSVAGRQRRPYIPILVAALGYFVDIYDLILFSIVRVPSLTALGLSGDALLESGVLLLNMQMAGMLVGGIAWGVIGDRRGRLSVLFGSIVLYSVANIANAFVQDVSTLRGAAVHRRRRPGRRAGRRHHAGERDPAEGGPRLRHDHRRQRRRDGRGGRRAGRRRLRLAHRLHRRRRDGAGAAGAAHRRVRVGAVRRGEADDGRARQLLRAVCQAGADAALSQRRPGRPADLVRHRHPDHVRAGAGRAPSACRRRHGPRARCCSPISA